MTLQVKIQWFKFTFSRTGVKSTVSQNVKLGPTLTFIKKNQTTKKTSSEKNSEPFFASTQTRFGSNWIWNKQKLILFKK